jgi:DNA-binding FadR family transcriptional regulator
MVNPELSPKALSEWTANLFDPLPMQNAGERVADRLVTAIALGEFVPGQRLPAERELAAMMNVSRGVIREAMQRLSASGYVTVRRGRAGGAFVESDWAPDAQAMIRRTLAPEWERLQHLLDLRSLVEAQIAATAATRRDRADIEEIRRAISAYATAEGDRHSSGVADRAVHLAIVQATHNPLLEALSQRIRLEVSLGFGAEPFSPEIRKAALHQHPELAEAVIAGDATEASRIAAAHFFLTEEHLRKLFDTVDAPRANDLPTIDHQGSTEEPPPNHDH